MRGTLELMRGGELFDDAERRLARLAAAQASLAIRAFGGSGTVDESIEAETLLTLVGEALAAGEDESRTAAKLARFGVDAARRSERTSLAPR